MTFQIAAHPEHAAGHLERAIQTGRPVLLPGTRESRRSGSATKEPAMNVRVGIDGVMAEPVVSRLDERMGAARVQNPLGRSLLYLTERFISLLRTPPAM